MTRPGAVTTALEALPGGRASTDAPADSGRVLEPSDAPGVSGDVALIAALAAGESVVGAARLAGVSERTVRRRRNDPTFIASVDAARLELLDESLGLLSASASVAVRVLRLIAADKQSGAPARVAAAGRLLDAVLRHRMALDLERRIELLERAAELQP